MLPIVRHFHGALVLSVIGAVVGFISAEFAAKAWVQGSPPTAITFYALSALGLLALGLAMRFILTILVALVIAIAAQFVPPLERYLDRRSRLRRVGGA